MSAINEITEKLYEVRDTMNGISGVMLGYSNVDFSEICDLEQIGWTFTMLYIELFKKANIIDKVIDQLNEYEKKSS